VRRGEEKELEERRRDEPRSNETDSSRNGKNLVWPRFANFVRLAFAMAAGCGMAACGGGAGSPSAPGVASSPDVTVQVTPSSASVLLGNSAAFSARVTGSGEPGVVWAVNGVPGGNATIGVISASGIYQAPGVLPTPSSIQIQATSLANSASSASAMVSLTSDVRVQVTPAATSVELGATLPFAATIVSAGHPANAVTWSVSGLGCAGSSCGSISSDGTFIAPGILPSAGSVWVLATSVADPGKTATATVALTSRFTLAAQGPATVAAGSSSTFTVTIQPVPGSNPAAGVTWSLSGSGCAAGPSACGTVSSEGLYTAPAVPPQPPQVTLTATSVADATKTASVTTQIVAAIPPLSISPANAAVALEQPLTFTAAFNGVPSQLLTWSVNTIPGGNTSIGTISNSPSQNGLYLAPVNMPAGRQVTISAAGTANPGLSVSVTLQLTSNITVSVSPSSAVHIPGARQTFTASVTQTSNPEISWAVNGVPNGNTTFGQICLPASDPCQPPPLAAAAGSVDYLAPSIAPAILQVTVQAASVADPASFASATVTITAQITVSISPPSLTVPPGQVQLFTANVLGAADQKVTWDVSGSINGSVAGGLICLPASLPCQAPNGPYAGAVEFRAPDVPPIPNGVSLRATSEASPSAQATALITISTAPYITGLVPASVLAGAAGSFGLRVEGVQFNASQPGPDAQIAVNGAARATNCPSAKECDTTLDPGDVAAPGSLTVNVLGPGSPPALSNSVSFIMVPQQPAPGVIPLSTSTPQASGIDIHVVEPTLAGSNPPEALSLLGIGRVDSASGTCSLAAPPLVLARPANGSSTRGSVYSALLSTEWRKLHSCLRPV